MESWEALRDGQKALQKFERDADDDGGGNAVTTG